jgi:hypothetical protein
LGGAFARARRGRMGEFVNRFFCSIHSECEFSEVELRFDLFEELSLNRFQPLPLSAVPRLYFP